jgi:V/A-type H+-transporting ATPase subunit F
MREFSSKIAVIGDREFILAFKITGADVFAAATPFDVRDALKKLSADGYAVIFITERLAESAAESVERYKTQAYPIILPIPDSAGSTGFGMRGLSKDVEKAVGADILFKENN